MIWEWKENKKCLGPVSTATAPLVTNPWRQDLKGTASLDAACLEHCRPQESAFLTTHTHARSLNEEDGDGEVLGENEWARATLSWILQLALVAMEIL